MTDTQLTPELIIDRFEQIVDNEMLVRGSYIEHWEDLASLTGNYEWVAETSKRMHDTGAICGGNRCCAMGSLWLAGGAAQVHTRTDNSVFISVPGAEAGPTQQMVLAANRPLAIALDALNRAAEDYVSERPEIEEHCDWSWGFHNQLESLFEHYPAELLAETDEERDNPDGIDPYTLGARMVPVLKEVCALAREHLKVTA